MAAADDSDEEQRRREAEALASLPFHQRLLVRVEVAALYALIIALIVIFLGDDLVQMLLDALA